MRFLLASFIFLLFFPFSQSALSADYFWRCGNNGCTEKTSPIESTKQSATLSGVTQGRMSTWTLESCTFISPTYASCKFKEPDVSNPNLFNKYTYFTNRYGDSCPSGHSYNSDTGVCDPPVNECEEKAGDSTPFSKSGDIGDGYYSVSPDGKYSGWPSDACLGGCAVAVQAGCKHRISANQYWCTGYAYYTGTSCAASTGAPQVESEENYRSEEPNTIEIKEPCIYTTDAEGRSVCVSKASLEKEGQHCGEYNGQTLCVPKTATSDEKTVETEVTEKVEPDGGKTTVKKDTATVTKCTGSNKNCTTTTTTTTTTSKSDGSGATTSTTVECKGKDCGSGTGGGGAGNGSGSGEGEEGEEGGELEGQDEVAGFGESLQDFNTRISAAPILSTVTSIAMPRGGSCSMPSANIPVIGSISFNWICDNADLLDPLYYVMLAIWALFATRVFLEA